MLTIVKCVAVHSCRLPFDIKVKNYLVAGERYLSSLEGEKKDGKYFRLLPSSCDCRMFTTRREAEMLVDTGQAEQIWKMKRGRMEPEMDLIWKAQQTKVPRIDLITTTDIEHAYTSDNPEVAAAAMEKIEMIHTMHQEELLKLFVPFRDDPTEGRLLFDFTDDERTPGGHYDSDQPIE